MQRYLWEETYSVGVKEIDQQHQHFFEIVNSIIELTEQKNIIIRNLLLKITELSDYGSYHLSTEESIFKNYNYPGAEDHIVAHDIYRQEIIKFIAESEKENVDVKELSLKIASFAGIWLAGHIMMLDKEYEVFMHEAGIK